MIDKEEIKLVRSYMGSILKSYSFNFDDDLLSELVGELVHNLATRQYVRAWRSSRSTLLYLECRTVICAWFARSRALKRQITPENAEALRDLLVRHASVPLDDRIDLRAFCERLPEKQQKVLKLISQGFTATEVAGETGISVPTQEKWLQQIRCDAAVHWELPDAQRLIALQEARREAKRKRDTARRQAMSKKH